jgi:hypothetical protein
MLTATRFTDLSVQMTGRVVIPSDPDWDATRQVFKSAGLPVLVQGGSVTSPDRGASYSREGGAVGLSRWDGPHWRAAADRYA